jgi:general secretion pathway protein A
MSPGYETYFGLDERPFSLTPDPKYFFVSRSHGAAIASVADGLQRRERFLQVTGDLGVGKTTLSRTLMTQLRSSMPVCFIANPLLTPGGLFRLLLEDFGALPATTRDGGGVATIDLQDLLVRFLGHSHRTCDRVVVIVDEAQMLPASVVDQLLALSALEQRRDMLVQLVLVGQPLLREPASQGVRALNDRITTTAQLMTLAADECASYVAHRLAVAGGGPPLTFLPGAIDMLFVLSGGMPRLLNLLAERALQHAAAERTHQIVPGMIDSAASALELMRGTPRRFRWFTRQVS